MVNLKKKYLKYKQKYLMDKLKGGSGVSTIFNALFSKEIQEQYGEEDLSEKLSFISYHLESMKELEDFFTTKSVSAPSLAGVAVGEGEGEGEGGVEGEEEGEEEGDDTVTISKVLVKGISKQIMPSIRRSSILFDKQQSSIKEKITEFIEAVIDAQSETSIDNDDTYQTTVIKGIFKVFTEILEEEEEKKDPSLSTSVMGATAIQRVQSNSSTITTTNTELSDLDSGSLFTQKNLEFRTLLNTLTENKSPTIEQAKELLNRFNAFIKTSIHLQIKYEHILQYIYSIYLVLTYTKATPSLGATSVGAQSLVTSPEFNIYIRNHIDYLYLPIFHTLDDKTLIELYKSRLTKIFNEEDVSKSETTEPKFLDYIKQVQASIKAKLNKLDKQEESEPKNIINVGTEKITMQKLENGKIVNYGEGEGEGDDCKQKYLVVKLD